jgi:hypothetical protein
LYEYTNNAIRTPLTRMGDDTERVSIHGRVFQKISIDEGIYYAPVASDGSEEDRLTAQHEILCRLFGDALVSSKVRIRDPSKVLDCGYGGGDWCVQIAEEFEDAEVGHLHRFMEPSCMKSAVIREVWSDCIR